MQVTATSKFSGLKLLLPSYLLGIIFDYFFFQGYVGISFPIFTTITFIIFVILTAKNRQLKFNINWLFIIPTFILAFSFAYTDNQVLRLINFFLVPVLFFWTLLMMTSSKKLHWFKSSFIGTYLIKIEQSLQSMIAPYQDAAKGQKMTPKSWDITKKILAGLGIGAVLAMVIIALLSSADILFSKLIEDFFDSFPALQMEDWLKHLIQIVLSASLIGGMFYAFLNKRTQQKDHETSIKPALDSITVNIALIMTIAIYIFFGVLQFIYLFGGEENILVHKMTYAAYAVRGFWELVAVAFINLAIILIGLHYTKLKSAAAKITTKISVALVNLLTFILIFSAHFRLNLYEETFGYTHSRIYAHIAIIFLFVLFVFVLYKIIRTKASFTRAAIIIWLVLYCILNLANIESMIVQKNFERYEKTGKLDVIYLYKLSADAMPDIYEKRHHALDNDLDLRSRIDKLLQSKYNTKYSLVEEESWFSYNYPRSKTHELFKTQYN